MQERIDIARTLATRLKASLIGIAEQVPSETIDRDPNLAGLLPPRNRSLVSVGSPETTPAAVTKPGNHVG